MPYLAFLLAVFVARDNPGRQSGAAVDERAPLLGEWTVADIRIGGGSLPLPSNSVALRKT